MDANIAQARGHLAEAEQKQNRLGILIDGDMLQLQQVLDPYTEDPCELNVETGKEVMDRLFGNVILARATRERIKKIKRSLGMES